MIVRKRRLQMCLTVVATVAFTIYYVSLGMEFRPVRGADLLQTTRLCDLLYDTGTTLDCYFTVERIEDRKDSPSLLSDGRTINVAGQPKTIEELVKVLGNELKGVTVSRDPQHKNIVRLTENRLSTVEKYAMSEKVTLKFRGLLSDMVDQLNAIDSRIRFPRSHPTNSAGPDYVTETDIDLKDVPIRTLATDSVPLKEYRRIIWIATTRGLETKPYTELFFKGWEDPDVPATKRLNRDISKSGG